MSPLTRWVTRACCNRETTGHGAPASRLARRARTASMNRAWICASLMLRRATIIARKTTSTANRPNNSPSRAARVCAPAISNACASHRCVRPLPLSDAVTIDNRGTRSRRPTPSNIAARTASAAAMTPLRPANAAKSPAKAIAWRSSADIGETDSVSSGFSSADCRCVARRGPGDPVSSGAALMPNPGVPARPL